MKKINIIIAAGGTSQRYGADNKLFAPCGQTCVLVETIKAFLPFAQISRIIVGLHPSFADELFIELAKAKLDEDARIKLARGGDSRTKTVRYSLGAVEDDCGIVLIHDGARPFVSKETIQSVIDGAIECGASLPLLPLTDNIINITDGGVSPLDRSNFRLVQTPAGFERDRLFKAYSLCDGDYLDDITVVQKFAPGKVRIVDGDKRNVKITVRSDLSIPLTGAGYDIHRLKRGNGIKLLGTEIDCPFSFIAHSDGDVPIHALMDAILSALGEKDIGHLYPVDDTKYDGADSAKLLEGVLNIMTERGYKLGNVTVTIIAERPKIAPYIDEMRTRMSALLALAQSNIGISATTNEEVGEIGKQKAIAAYASVLLLPV